MMMQDMSILIIENDFNIFLNITKSLKKFGLTNIYHVLNTTEAYEIYVRNRIDLLILDIDIGGEFESIDFIKTIQDLYKLPVIIITQCQEYNILKRVAKIDFMGYLLKPYNS